eukprot:12027644-Alexandrium_andersonii.AAC.1
MSASLVGSEMCIRDRVIQRLRPWAGVVLRWSVSIPAASVGRRLRWPVAASAGPHARRRLRDAAYSRTS